VEEIINIEFTPEFKRNVRALSKKYRHIRSDIQPLIEQLEKGEIVGDKIPGVKYSVFKVRILNSDIQKGKSAGYRLIYYFKSSKNIILITIYSKSDQSDITATKIRSIINAFDI
jgi:mRNA-degrading endonuclease RelE of RelBE toxin-antitoxin system